MKILPTSVDNVVAMLKSDFLATLWQLSDDTVTTLQWRKFIYFLKQANSFETFSFHWGCISSLRFLSCSKSFIMLSSHPTPYFKVDSKTNHLEL